MEMINVNLTDVDDGLEPHPEGIHPMLIQSATPKHKEGKDYPYIELVLKPVPGTGDPKYANKNLWLNLSFHPKALWNMKQLFQKLNMPMDLRGKNLAEISQMLVGQQFRPKISVVSSDRDPDKKVNDVGPPYHAMS